MRHLVFLEMALQIIAHLAFNRSDLSFKFHFIFRLSFIFCGAHVRLNFRLKLQHSHLLVQHIVVLSLRQWRQLLRFLTRVPEVEKALRRFLSKRGLTRVGFYISRAESGTRFRD